MGTAEIIGWAIVAALVLVIVFLKMLSKHYQRKLKHLEEHGHMLSKEAARLDEQNRQLDRMLGEVAELRKETEALEEQVRRKH